MKTLRTPSVERIRSPHPRGGVTLTEVLMSLMIMSIGIVSVATLFPLSTLRVIEASRQTNSTITRFGAEAVIDVDSSFLHNPDGTFPPGGADLTPYNGPAFRGQVYLVDPYGWQTFHRDGAFPALSAPGPLAVVSTPPLRDTLGHLATGSTVNVPLMRRYSGATMFSNFGINPYPTIASDSDTAINRAVVLVGQPDNWKLITQTDVTTAATPIPGITSLTLDIDADLSAVSVSPGVTYRAVVFDLSGKHSEWRYLTTNPTGQTLAFTPALPSRFDASPTGVSPNVGKVRIEVQDEVYTWAMSVRKRQSGPANVDVVVFFKRSFNPEHEYVYPAAMRRYTLGTDGAPGVAGVDDNGINGTDDVSEIGYQGSDDLPNSVVTVDFSSLPAGSDTPAFRRGGYVCDTKNGLWYRVQAIQNETESTADLVLDKFVQKNNTEDLFNFGTVDAGEDVNNDNVVQLGGLYWNPTVVNVFPLEIKEP